MIHKRVIPAFVPNVRTSNNFKLLVWYAGVTVGLFFFLPSVNALLIRDDKPQKMVVTISVADIRAKPIRHTPDYNYDPLQETQVLKGEIVMVREEKDGWMRVSVPDQAEYTHNDKWEGYPGWIEAKYLSGDVELFALPKKPKPAPTEIRTKILAAAAKHLGNPYLWGGRSLHNPSYSETVTGVDCSGLVNLSYHEAGYTLPRDAHEQYMRARRIDAKHLKPADLIFLAKTEKPDKIVHVAMYKGEEMLIEAPSSGERVREMSIQQRFGKKLLDLKNGDRVDDRVIYFGTYLRGIP